MIILARESRGLTQKDLAEKLKIEQSEISRLESGFIPRLPDERISALAKLLRYPKTFFFQSGNIYGMPTFFYRKHKGLPKKDLKQILAVMNVFRMNTEKLLSSVDIDFVAIKECTVAEYGSPEKIAQEIRQYLRLPRGRVENMTQVIERFGVIVIPYNFGSRKFSGASLALEGGGHFVFINEMCADRWRFTLAHELGHIIMHNFTKPDDPTEEEADRFASEFLMPEEDIYPHLSNISLDTLASLKLYWRTSMSSILMKARDLGTISDRHYRSMWQKMGSLSYRLQEPPELEPPQEKPLLLKEIVDFHLLDLKFSPENLSERFCIEPEDFYKIYSIPKRHLRLVS